MGCRRDNGELGGALLAAGRGLPAAGPGSPLLPELRDFVSLPQFCRDPGPPARRDVCCILPISATPALSRSKTQRQTEFTAKIFIISSENIQQ